MVNNDRIIVDLNVSFECKQTIRFHVLLGQ